MIPLLNGDTILISPRVGNRAFARMVSVINNLQDSHHEGLVGVSASDTAPINWIELLGQSFVRHLQNIETQGLRFEIVARPTTGSFAKGKINFRKTYTRLERKSAAPVVSTQKFRSNSTTENKLLATVAALVNRTLYKNKELTLQKWSTLIETDPFSYSEYMDVIQRLNKGQFDDYRSYYKPAIRVAMLLLPNNGSGISFEDASIQSAPFMTNVNQLYEEYIRTIISSGLVTKGLVVEKPKSGFTTLFTDGNYKLIPDVTISRDNHVRLIGDMKYKPKDETVGQDYYQLKTYIDAHNISSGFLVRPALANGESKSTIHKYFDGKYAIDVVLNMTDLDNSEAFLLEQLNVLVS
jgi:5-methylcytosine-specific restriction endonuclease McrBC regulatory subunit McrC